MDKKRKREMQKKLRRERKADARESAKKSGNRKKGRAATGSEAVLQGSRILKVLIIVVLVVLAFLLLWVFLIAPRLSSGGSSEGGGASSSSESSKSIEELVAEKPHTEINHENGLIYRDNALIVFAKDGATESSMEKLAKQQGAELDSSMAKYGIYYLHFDGSKTYDELDAAVTALKADSNVEDATLNLDTMAQVQTESIPNDPWKEDGEWFNDVDWNVDDPGGRNWGLEAIDAPRAWEHLDEMQDVNISLIENPPNVNHEDFDFDMFECTSSSNWGSIDVEPSLTDEKADHASHVAGIMGATWNNGVGISGVTANKGHLYYYGAFYDRDDEDYQGWYYDSRIDMSNASATDLESIVKMISTLLDNDVRVINYSQGLTLLPAAASWGNENALSHISRASAVIERQLKKIIESRQESGEGDFVICVSAGNDNDKAYYVDENADYGFSEKASQVGDWLAGCFGLGGRRGGVEALYNSVFTAITDQTVRNHIIVVGSVKLNTGPFVSEKYSYSGFSDIGSRVDVAAPGEGIYSCVSSGYGDKSGTSMACPFVAGTAGLLFACDPSLTAAEVKEIITSTTTKEFYYQDGHSGLLNTGAAVEKALEQKKAKEEEQKKKELEEAAKASPSPSPSPSPSASSSATTAGFSLVGTWVASDGTKVTFGSDGAFSFDMSLGLSDEGTYSVQSTATNPFAIEIDSDGLLSLMKLAYGSADSSYHFEILVTDSTHIDLVQVYGDYTASTSPCKLPLTKKQ